MSVKKYGLTVTCEQCRYVTAHDADTFDVAVPIDDAETGVHGVARLRCSVSPTGHCIELDAWTDADEQPAELPPELRQRLNATLDFAAEHRLCGNRHLCPAAVVEIVKTRIEG